MCVPISIEFVSFYRTCSKLSWFCLSHSAWVFRGRIELRPNSPFLQLTRFWMTFHARFHLFCLIAHLSTKLAIRCFQINIWKGDLFSLCVLWPLCLGYKCVSVWGRAFRRRFAFFLSRTLLTYPRLQICPTRFVNNFFTILLMVFVCL